MRRTIQLTVALVLVTTTSHADDAEPPHTLELAPCLDAGVGLTGDEPLRLRPGPYFAPGFELRYMTPGGHGFVTSFEALLHDWFDYTYALGYFAYFAYGHQLAFRFQKHEWWIDVTPHLGLATGWLRWFVREAEGSVTMIGPRVGIDLTVHRGRFLVGLGVAYSPQLTPGGGEDADGIHFVGGHFRIGGSTELAAY